MFKRILTQKIAVAIPPSDYPFICKKTIYKQVFICRKIGIRKNRSKILEWTIRVYKEISHTVCFENGQFYKRILLSNERARRICSLMKRVWYYKLWSSSKQASALLEYLEWLVSYLAKKKQLRVALQKIFH